MKPANIHPIFDQLVSRGEKEDLLNQRSVVLWFTGLSGSGKSTIAKGVERQLHKLGYITEVLDGDNVRTGINNNLGFSEADRMENIRRIAEISKLFINCGIITINSFVSPTASIRQLAREIIGAGDFVEIYVNCPLEVCEDRDVKGLYKKARQGEIKDFTGIDAPFEAPIAPELEIFTDEQPVEESIKAVLSYILPKIEHKE